MTATVVAECGGGSHPAAAGSTGFPRPYVLISGRDDHGLLQLPRVPLYEKPGGTTEVAEVADGTLARVLVERGSWVRLAPVDGVSPSGWSDDFRLRGVVHLVGPAPACRVPLGGRRLPAGEQATVLAVHGGTVQVRLVRRPAVTGAVPLRFVRELPPSPDNPCPSP